MSRRRSRARADSRRGSRRASPLTVLLLLIVWASGAARTEAQVGDGSASRTLGGAALGLYSGGMLGVVGSLLPCDRTLHGRACVAASGTAGALTGLISGAVIGGRDRSQLDHRARGAAYGTLVGTAVGLALQQAVRQYTWHDALLVGAFGAAVGASPRGVLMGTGVGAVVGGLAWAASPRGGVQDVILFTVVGAGLGGLVDWGHGAWMTSAFSIPLG